LGNSIKIAAVVAWLLFCGSAATKGPTNNEKPKIRQKSKYGLEMSTTIPHLNETQRKADSLSPTDVPVTLLSVLYHVHSKVVSDREGSTRGNVEEAGRGNGFSGKKNKRRRGEATRRYHFPLSKS